MEAEHPAQWQHQSSTAPTPYNLQQKQPPNELTKPAVQSTPPKMVDVPQDNPVDSWEDIADSDTSRGTGGSPKTSAVATPPDEKISETDKKRAEEARVDMKLSETTPPVRKSQLMPADAKTLESSSGSSLSSNSSTKERSNGRGSKAEGGGGSSKASQLQAAPKPKDDKENVNIIFIGHVDAGKSTIGGHLM